MSLSPFPTITKQGDTARKQRHFWAVTDDHAVVEVTGYACSDDDNGFWWCPKVGFSACPGGSLFDTQFEAAAKAVKDAKAVIAKATEAIRKLESL